ncbi:MAG: nicotinate-nucleotide--dimethylbenzimidazole phosphoribosyltransferase [Spirochaetota bacterium]|nr:nicotinate-nucleotide--dimethylbenzimidazole phosphoribosyltransferase [Spirochaetota bacterium]
MKALDDVVKCIKPINYDLMNKAQSKLDNLTKPQGSLGRLEEFAKKIVCITGTLSPTIPNKVIFTIAGDHGVAEEGVSLFPKEVTEQMVYNFLQGGAGVNVISKHIGARVVVVDMGVASDLREEPGLVVKKIGYGTDNMTKGPAMKRDDAIKSIEGGINLIEAELKKNKVDIIGIGDMGIANTTSSSAICSCITGADVVDVTGRGTGIDDEHLEIKIDVIKRSIEINNPDPKDPIDVLSKVGGYEIGGLAGIILGAVAHNIPVVLDGFITTCAALIATTISPISKEYIFGSHNSVEIGHSVALNWMGIEPMFNLKMRLGEGTGACLAISFIETGVKILNEMTTFEDAGVSKEKN